MHLHIGASLLRDVLEDSVFFESHLFECLGQENLVQLPFCLETLYYIPSQSCGGALAVPDMAWWPRGAPEPAHGQELQDMERFPGGGEGMASPGPSPESWGLVQVLAEPHSCEGVQRSPQKLSSVLGAEVSASRAVPRAVGCFLRAWWRAEVGGRGKTTSHYTLCGAACGGP